MITFLALAVKASALLGAGLVAAICLRRTSAATRHFVLACTVLAALLLPLAAFVVPEWELPASVAPVVGAPRSTSTPTTPVAGGMVTPIDVRAAALAWDTVLSLAWLSGAVFVFGSLVVGAVRLRGFHRSAQTADAAWHSQVEAVARRAGVRRRIAVLISAEPIVPLTWGYVRPCILLPAEAVRWPDARRATVIAHEVSHIARGDWLMRLLGQTLCALHWFNPLAWLVCRRRHEESERACDDRVLAGGVDPADYASLLLDLARSTRAAAAVPAPAILRASNLERRIRAMLNPTVNRSLSTRRHQALIACVALAVLVALAAVGAAQTLASFSGSLIDEQRGMLPGARLTLTAADGTTRIEVQSDRNGRFEFPPLLPGTYAMEARLSGFASFTSTVTLRAGQRAEPEFQLSVGGLQETVYVVDSGSPAGNAQPRVAQTARPRPLPPCPANTGSDRRVGGNIRPPIRTRNAAPVYPTTLTGSGRSEIVKINGTIGLDGKLEDLQVVGSPAPEFEQAALDAVREWQWDATLLNCSPVRVNVEMQVNFAGRQR